MFPRSPAPSGRSAYIIGLHPPPHVPQYHNRTGVNSFHVPGLERLPTYEWRPTPPASPVLPPHRPTMTNGRKRQNNDYSPHVVKHRRLDTPSYPVISSPLIWAPPPPPPDQVVAGSSRTGYDRSYSSTHSHPHPEVSAVPEGPSSLQAYAKDRLSCQMVELFEACQQQSSDLSRKEMCRTRLQQDIQRIYAVARLYLNGSSMNGLGCRSSDADLCLVLKGKKRHDPIYVLSVLQKLFKSLSYVERTQLIRAKVPILRFREKGSDLEFDLNVNNTVGIRNTFLLRSYAYADLRIRPLILVVKKWARHHQINDASKGTLSSYTLVLMVLHYLQTLKEPVLPSLQKDYPECFNPLMDIDAVPEGPKNIPPYISRNQSSLGELLLGFLKYYAAYFRLSLSSGPLANFFTLSSYLSLLPLFLVSCIWLKDKNRWDKQVISVREARALPKNNSQEWRNKYICVEEPFERNNVARAVHEKIKFDAIKAQFAESCRILQQRKDLNSVLPVRSIINKESSTR